MGTVFDTDLKQAVEALKLEAGSSWRAPSKLVRRAKTYYKKNIEKVRGYIKIAGISEQDARPIIEDYARALFGVYDYKATREEMARFCTAARASALLSDRYALFFGVLDGYSGVLEGLEEYDKLTAPPEQYRGTMAQADAVEAYLHGPSSAPESRAVMYLSARGIFDGGKLSDNPVTVSEYVARCRSFREIYEYSVYYAIAKYCLSATPEDLEQIKAPAEGLGGMRPEQFGEKCSASIAMYVDKLRDGVPAEQIKHKSGSVSVAKTIVSLLSRDVYGSKTGEKISSEKDILPIQMFINEYLDRNPHIKARTTPRIVEKAIEGVNMLHRINKVTPVDGYCSIHTNISEFAELAGYSDANMEEKRDLLAALFVLDGLFLVVWSDKGMSAKRLITVREIGLSGKIKGDLLINVSVTAIKGRPQLINVGDFERLKREARGYAENHFRYQIVGKGHKEEKKLLDEIFGYSTTLREAEEQGADEQTLKGMRITFSKNMSKDRRKLQKMFERQQEAKFLTFEKYTNEKGETIYKWTRKE